MVFRPVKRRKHLSVALAPPHPEPRLAEQQVGDDAHDRQRQQQHDPRCRHLRTVALAVEHPQARDHTDHHVHNDRQHHRGKCARAGVDEFSHVDVGSVVARTIR